MIYLWEVPENYRNRDIGEYEHDCSPDRFLLRKGCRLEKSEFLPVPKVTFEVPKSRVLSFDCLPNNASVPLVNERVKDLLEKWASDDVQFFPSKCICADGILDGYYFINITHTIVGIDHEKSVYTKMKLADAISGFRYLTYQSECMGNYHLARDSEYKGNLLISETIKSAFEKEKVTGVWCVRPEDYYKPINELL